RATFLAELDLASLFAVRRTANAILPSRFPAAWRDLAFVVAETVTWREARDEIEAAGGKTGLETVALRDVYRGPQVGDGKRSFAVRLTFRSATATLSDADVDRALGRIEGRLRHRFGATLRAP
ncbi:MAG: phenylalanine--tRNA ligase subunit beta, partial [Chloroflexi bacterium]|nr:phenylalanine--tRNA ligase subunit beta [Chloroflexota bacterium]